MTGLVLAICVFIVCIGATGVFSPAALIRLVRRFQTPNGLYVAAALRLLLGVALIVVAPTSKSPDIVRVVGVIAIGAGLLLPLFGLERLGKIVDWWSAQGPIVIRIWAGVAMVFGLALGWAVLP